MDGPFDSDLLIAELRRQLAAAEARAEFESKVSQHAEQHLRDFIRLQSATPSEHSMASHPPRPLAWPSTMSPAPAASSATRMSKALGGPASMRGRGLFSGVSSPSQSEDGDSYRAPPELSEWAGRESTSQRGSPSSPGERRAVAARSIAAHNNLAHDVLDQALRRQRPPSKAEASIHHHASPTPPVGQFAAPMLTPLSWRQAAGIDSHQSLMGEPQTGPWAEGAWGSPGPSHMVQHHVETPSKASLSMEQLLSRQERLLQAYDQHIHMIEAAHAQRSPMRSPELGAAASRQQRRTPDKGTEISGNPTFAEGISGSDAHGIASHDDVSFSLLGSKRSLSREINTASARLEPVHEVSPPWDLPRDVFKSQMHSAANELSQIRSLFASLEAQIKEQQKWNQQQQEQQAQRQQEGQARCHEEVSRRGDVEPPPAQSVLKRQNQVLERLLKQVSASKDELVATHNALESSRDELVAKVGRLEERCKDLEVRLRHSEQLRESELEAGRALQLEGASHLGRLQQRCVALEAELDTSNLALASASEEAARFEKVLRDQEDRAFIQLQDKEEEAVLLQKSLSNKEREANTLQELLVKANEEVTAMKQCVLVKEEECSSLQLLLEERNKSLKEKQREMDQSLLDGEQRLMELQQLSMSLQNCSEQHSAALQRRLDELTAELAKSDQSHSLQRKEWEEMLSIAAAQHAERLHEVSTHQEVLCGQHNDLKKQYAMLSLSNESLQAQLEDLSKAKIDLQREISEMISANESRQQSELDRFRMEVDGRAKEMLLLMAGLERLDFGTQGRADAERQIHQQIAEGLQMLHSNPVGQQSLEENVEGRLQNSSVVRQIDVSELEGLRSELKAALESSEASTKECLELQSRCTELETRCQELSSSLQAAETKDHQRQLAELEERMVLQSRCLELCASLEAAELAWSKQEAEVKELRSRCWEADSLLASAYEDEHRAAAREMAIEEEKQLAKARCLILEDENQSMALQQKLLEDEACALRMQIEQTTGNLDCPKAMVSEERKGLECRCEQLSLELAETKGRCEGLQWELAAVQEAIEAERGALQSMVDGAVASAEGCRSELEVAKEGNLGLELQVQELEDLLRQAERQLEDSMRQREALEAAQALVKTERDSLKCSLDMALAEKEELIASASAFSVGQQQQPSVLASPTEIQKWVSELVRITEETDRHAALEAGATASLLGGYEVLLKELAAKHEFAEAEASRALSEATCNLNALKLENESLRQDRMSASNEGAAAITASSGFVAKPGQTGQQPSSPLNVGGSQSQDSSPHRLVEVGYEQAMSSNGIEASQGSLGPSIDEGSSGSLPCDACPHIQAQLEASQARVLELQAKEQQLRGRLEGLGRLMSLLATKLSEALRRYETAQGNYGEISKSGQDVSEQLFKAIETLSGHQRAQLNTAEQALASASEEGFRHLEEERRLQELSRSLETAVGELWTVEKRAAMVLSVRDAMQQQILSAQQQEMEKTVASEGYEGPSEDWHDFATAPGE